MPQETELKLRLAEADLPRLRRALSRLEKASPPRRQRLFSIYFDTPALDLLAAGQALRLRRVGRQWVQTLKGGGGVAAGLHRREERECRLSHGVPDIAAIASWLPAPARAVPLLPVFTTDFRRQTWTIHHGRAVVEVALDQGAIHSGARREPLLELELERLAGPTDALYALAASLAEALALFPEPRSKAERGYALFLGRPLAPSKAVLPQLAPTIPVEEAFGLLVGACLEHIQRNQAGVIASDDPEFVHQMRVGLRRLRAVLSLFSPMVPPASWAPWRDELRWLAGELGAARDWDVLQEECLPAFAAAGGPVTRLARAVARRRTKERQRARLAAASPRYARLMLALGRWLLRRGWRRRAEAERRAALSAPARAFARERLATRHARLLRQGRHLARLTAQERHRLRIRAKKMRYGAEAFASLFEPARARPYLEALAALQDLLGHLNDLTTARAHICRLCARARCREESTRFGEWASAHEERALGRLRACWKRLLRRERFWES